MLLIAAHSPVDPMFRARPRLPVDLEPDFSRLASAVQDHVLNYQANDLLAVGLGRRRRRPEFRQVLTQPQYALSIFVRQDPMMLFAPRRKLFLHLLDGAELLLPEAFEAPRDQAILRLAST